MIIDDYLKYQDEYQKKYGENTIIIMQVGSFFELYAIYDDESEHLINTENDFKDAINEKCINAIELCFINEIKPIN